MIPPVMQRKRAEGIDRSGRLCHKGTMEASWRHTLSAGATSFGVTLGEAELDLFSRYRQELLLWNRRINLVSGQTTREIAIRHFLDSLTPAPWIEQREGLCLDLGTGGGFPGIPLRIAFPRLRLTLVESSRKKTSFLSHIVRTLGLADVTIIRERVEALTGQPLCAGTFDTVVSRAAFKLPELVRMASFFLRTGGVLIAQKGPDPRQEMEEAKEALGPLGMICAACRDITLPCVNSQRKIVIYKRFSR